MYLPESVFFTDGSYVCDRMFNDIRGHKACRKIPITEVDIGDVGDTLSVKRPVSMILPITDSMLSTAEFISCVKAIAHYMSEAEGTSVRCLIYPLDMSYNDFKEKCDAACRDKYKDLPYNEGLYLIQDHIHHAEFRAIEDLGTEFALSVKNAEIVKNYYNSMRIRGWVQTFAGYLMQMGTIAAHIITPVIAVLLDEKISVNLIPRLQKPHEWVLGLLESKWLPLIVLAFAITLVYSLTNIFYWLKGNSKKMAGLNTSKTAYAALLYSGLPYICNVLLFRLIFRQHLSLIILCVVAAFCMDVIRRSRYNTVRRHKALNKPNITNKQDTPIEKSLLEVRSQFVTAPFRVPYLAREDKPVFISYTHVSEWAQDMAEQLYQELKNLGITCFLDKYNIARGSSWHKRLTERMDTAHTVICLVDEHSIGNAWPAEELETSLRLRSISGNPTVYLLLKKNLPVDSLKKMPVFEEVLRRADTKEEMAFVLNETDNSPALIAARLKNHGQTNSVFGHFGSVTMELLRLPLYILTLSVTSWLWVVFCIAAVVNYNMSFFENQIEQSQIACLIYFLFACYLFTVSVIDVLSRGFLYMPVEAGAGMGALIGLLAGCLNGYMAIYVVYNCITNMSLSIEHALMALICVVVGACSITSCHENMVRLKTIRLGNEV